MTTKAPAKVVAGELTSLESIAYQSVAGIPVADPRDRDRLGYCVWHALTNKREGLDVAIGASRIRFTIGFDDAVGRIRGELKARGVAEA
jgi:hypothetical protein